MLNKLKTTTALVGALSIAATASFAETKITGDIEQTYISHSQDLAANKINGAGGFGHETNLTLTSSKDLANGWKANFGYTLEQNGRTAASDQKYLSLSSGNFFVAVGEDHGDNLQATVIPFVSDNFETIGGSSGAGLSFDSHGSTLFGTTNLNVHEFSNIAAGFKFDGGVATFRYAPNASNGSDDTTITGSAQSAMEYLISGKFQGVGYRLGKMQAEQANSADAGSKPDYTVYGLSYGMNGFTVAAERRNTDDGTTAATAETKATQYGVAYATKDFSAGIYMLKNDRDATAVEEEAKMIQVGYNIGGLGFDVSYMQIENANFASGADADVWQIRTVQKF